ncbi:MAG: hypothetical protein S4CHLAM2_02540 [Chlamydiales bacterium]|nr:hypothetical protein [Chlamydiales bacterium]
MKKLFFIFLFSFSFLIPLEAQWCFYPCTERYYNPGWSNGDNRFYGYIDINEYPYDLPVNYCFNPRPCGSGGCYSNTNYYIWSAECEERYEVCPHCNGCHN